MTGLPQTSLQTPCPEKCVMQWTNMHASRILTVACASRCRETCKHRSRLEGSQIQNFRLPGHIRERSVYFVRSISSHVEHKAYKAKTKLLAYDREQTEPFGVEKVCSTELRRESGLPI